MNIDKLFLALDREHRSAIISIIGCSVVIYVNLFLIIESYKSYEWYQQILIAIGSATSYMITFAPIYLNNSIEKCFYYPLYQLSISSFIFYVVASVYKKYLAFGFACCFVVGLVLCLYFAYKINKEDPK